MKYLIDMDNKRVIKEANRNKFLAGILNESLSAVDGNEKSEDFEVKEFRFKVKHDNGFKKLKTKASSLEAAKKIIMNAEGCPEGALELISEVVINENLESNQLTPDGIANECLSYLMVGSFDLIGAKIIKKGHEWSTREFYSRYGKPSKKLYDTLDISTSLSIDTDENVSYEVDFIFKAVIYSKGSPETNSSMDPQNDTGSDAEYNTELKTIIIKDKNNKVVWSRNVEPDKNPLTKRDLGGFENFFNEGNFDFDKELDSVIESYIIDGSDGFREPEDMRGYRSSDMEAKEWGGMDV